MEKKYKKKTWNKTTQLLKELCSFTYIQLPVLIVVKENICLVKRPS